MHACSEADADERMACVRVRVHVRVLVCAGSVRAGGTTEGQWRPRALGALPSGGGLSPPSRFQSKGTQPRVEGLSEEQPGRQPPNHE